MNQKVLIGAILGVVIVGAGAWLLFAAPKSYLNIMSYDECVAAGYPIMESYPEQCRTPDGRTFVHDISNNGSGATTTPPVTTPAGGATVTGTFNKSVTIRVKDKVNFPDGFSLTLKEISDSRCPSDVVCIWQGELSPLFGATLAGSSEEFRLGTVTTKSASVKGHTITLQSATPTTVSITVVVSPSAPAASGVSGYIHTGPTCPVVHFPPDDNCADRAFAGAKVAIKSKADGSIVSLATSDAEGKFRVTLATGSYVIDTTAADGGRLPNCETKEATVKAGQFTSVDISCDSGIR